MTTSWRVICEPIDGDPPGDKNTAGIVVLITNGDEQHPVGRIAYARHNSRNPDVAFDDQLHATIEKGTLAAQTMNDMQTDLDAALTEATAAARKRVREVLGRPSQSSKPE